MPRCYLIRRQRIRRFAKNGVRIMSITQGGDPISNMTMIMRCSTTSFRLASVPRHELRLPVDDRPVLPYIPCGIPVGFSRPLWDEPIGLA
jgi:hypothetical protein